MKFLNPSMDFPTVTPEEMKKAAAIEALKLVRDGMVLGIGTGSTVNYFIDALKDLVAQGVRIRGVATSIESSERARAAGVNVEEDYAGNVDLDVDGADEMDGSGNLVKGGGGALLREKIVAYNSRIPKLDCRMTRRVLISDVQQPCPCWMTWLMIQMFPHTGGLRFIQSSAGLRLWLNPDFLSKFRFS